MPTIAPKKAYGHVRSALERLEGVRAAHVEPDGSRVWIASETGDLPVEMSIRRIITEEGLAVDTPLEIAAAATPESRKRVRFHGATLTPVAPGLGRAEVQVEWGGRIYAGTAQGETHCAMEHRLFASATLRCLEAVLGGEIGIFVVGLKPVRAFDADIIVVLLRTVAGTSLVGASLVPGDPHSSVARAVLNATNRVFGNYLTVST
jgi:hypothetical protein